MSNLEHDGFRCAHCLGQLQEGPADVHCNKCGAVFPVRDRIVQFGGKSDYYFGELPQSRMWQLLGVTKTSGLAFALQKLGDKLADEIGIDLRQYAFDDRRASWKFVTHLPERGGVALDCGCGWGVLTLNLAQNFERVIAMDLTPERAALVQQRIEESGLSNVSVVQGGDTAYLPFENNSLDLVVLNGVLEWVPCNRKGNPRKVQLQFLREIHRVLKPGGELYLAIENRYSFTYLLGRRDHHSRLRFVPFLPRWAAHVWSFLHQRRGYRNYLYGYGGYRRLLAQGGFVDSKVYVPWRHYAQFGALFAAEQRRSVVTAINPTSQRGRLFVKFCSPLNVIKYFSPCFSIVSCKTERRESFADRVVSDIAQAIGCRDDQLSWSHISTATGSDKAMLHVCSNSDVGRKYIAIMGLNSRESERVRRGGQALDAVHADADLSAAIKALIPKVLVSGRKAGQYFVVETTVSGECAYHFRGDAARSSRAIGAGAEFLKEVHKSTCRVKECDCESYLAPIKELRRKYPLAMSAATELSVQTFICERLKNVAVPVVLGHGDFGVQHLFTDAGQCLTGVIDWEYANNSDWPLFDLLYLFATYRSWTQNETMAQTWVDMLRQMAQGGGELSHLYTYAKSLGLAPEVVGAIAFASFFRIVVFSDYLASLYAPRRSYGVASMVADLDGVVGRLVPVLTSLESKMKVFSSDQ